MKRIVSAVVAVRCFSMLVVLLSARYAGAQAAASFGMNLNGTPVATLAPEGTRAVVLFFAACDCPISNRYIPEFTRLRQEFAGRGVQFWEVYPNPEDTAAKVQRHVTQFRDDASVVVDTEQSLVRMAHVTVTPEAAVFLWDENKLREVYHGRIDDRYLAFGSERPQALHHDLEAAISSALENKPVPQPGGPAVGCAIVPRQP